MPPRSSDSSPFGNIKRKAVSLSTGELVTTSRFEHELPVVVQPAVEGVNLITWAANNRDFIDAQLLKTGGILFRGFDVASIEQFEEFVGSMSRDLLDYSYRSTPRSQVSGKIYTSTEYPADQMIPLHNELSYSRQWPLKIWFYSVQVAEQGGETPIVDSRAVFNRIDPAIRERFATKQIMYVRNYGDGLDIPWEEVFQTADRSEVEAFCHTNGIACEWKGNNRLRTVQVCQAVAAHPQTGEMVWFNQAHLFHISNLAPELRERLIAEFKDDLPRNVYYGDGSPIEDEALDSIRACYQQEMIAFPWQERDILMLDNMLVAHGRMPFAGRRKVVVGMAESFSQDKLS